jgi:hypothetical protein
VKTAALFSQNLDDRRRLYILASVTAGIVVTGLFAQDIFAFYLVAIPTIVPLYLWMRAGALGMPVLPLIAALFFVYYAIPLLRGSIAAYGSDEIFDAAATTGSFLLAASAGSWLFLYRARQKAFKAAKNLVSETQIVRLTFIGLGGGIAYHVALISGSLGWLGSSVGLVRAIVLTLTSVACYLLGCARAARSITGMPWVIALFCVCIIVILASSSLILVGGVMSVFAAILGYMVSAKRIPVFTLVFAIAILSVLHAGKFEMRKKYWLPRSQSMQEISLAQVPGLMTEWLSAGVNIMTSGTAETNVLERASLLHMLLLVRRETPGIIPYMEGETYALLPSMLMPRFLEPEKTISQAGLNMLSIRYGLQTQEATGATTIAWGLVAEAYANYGITAVLAVGALFGALCGGLTRLSIGAPPLSLPMLVTIAGTLVLVTVEDDLSYLLTTLMQTIAAVLLIAALPRLLKGRGPAAAGPESASHSAGV